MYKLKVEELESRQLLNNSSFFLEPPPAQPFGAFTYALVVVERSSFVDYGVVVERSSFVDYGIYAGPFGSGWLREGGFRSFADPGFDARGLGALGPRLPDHQSPGPARPGTWVSGAMGVGDQPGAGPDAVAGQEAAMFNTGATPPAPSVPANGIRGANGASAEAFLTIPLEQPTPQPRPPLETLVGARGLPVQVQALSAERSPVWAVRGDARGSGSNLREESWKLHNRPGMSATAQAREESEPPSPRMFDVLAVFPGVDLSALELGMQQFLQQLEKLGPRLAMGGEGSGLWPWIVAVTAAATACEIARRELRQPPSVLAVAANGMSGFPSDHLFGGSS